jgi:hypothetical protein
MYELEGYTKLIIAVIAQKDYYPNYIFLEDLIDDVREILPEAQVVDILLEAANLAVRYPKSTVKYLGERLYQINCSKYIAKILEEKYGKKANDNRGQSQG